MTPPEKAQIVTRNEEAFYSAGKGTLGVSGLADISRIPSTVGTMGSNPGSTGVRTLPSPQTVEGFELFPV